MDKNTHGLIISSTGSPFYYIHLCVSGFNLRQIRRKLVCLQFFLFKNRSSGFRNPIRRISQNSNLVLLKSWFEMRAFRSLVDLLYPFKFSQNDHPFIYDMSLNQIVSTNLFQKGLVLIDKHPSTVPPLEKERTYHELPLNLQVYGSI
jgi:hypothetical protein